MRALATAMMAYCCLMGCTHQALRQHTVLTAATLTELQYQMVLSNIAMFSCHPGLLPWHVRLRDGVVQVNDEGRFNAESLLYMEGALGFYELGPRFSRNVTEQWDVSPLTDPKRLKTLQAAYQKLFGMPVDESLFMLDEGENGERAAEQENSADQPEQDPEDQNDQNGDDENNGPDLIGFALVSAEFLPGEERSSDGDHSKRSSDRRTETRRSRREVPEIPRGWFHLGEKRDVPKEARFVGRYGDRYAWVMPDGVEELTQFTLLVLTITRLDEGEIQPGRGVIFSPRGF